MKILTIIILVLQACSLSSKEMIIGEERISPGIIIKFEAAPKDSIYPSNFFLEESETDIHIEMLINWAEDSPSESPIGGFIPYLNVSAVIKNNDGNKLEVELKPHLNLSDNFHYARNIKLPGSIDDKYDVIIKISPPTEGDLGIHKDWKDKYGSLIGEYIFKYYDLSFENIAIQTR